MNDTLMDLRVFTTPMIFWIFEKNVLDFFCGAPLFFFSSDSSGKLLPQRFEEDAALARARCPRCDFETSTHSRREARTGLVQKS